MGPLSMTSTKGLFLVEPSARFGSTLARALWISLLLHALLLLDVAPIKVSDALVGGDARLNATIRSHHSYPIPVLRYQPPVHRFASTAATGPSPKVFAQAPVAPTIASPEKATLSEVSGLPLVAYRLRLAQEIRRRHLGEVGRAAPHAKLRFLLSLDSVGGMRIEWDAPPLSAADRARLEQAVLGSASAIPAPLVVGQPAKIPIVLELGSLD